FGELIDLGVCKDTHPAGVQVFLFYWIKLFGISEAAVRLPFVIAGILSVLLVYLIAKRWFNETVALLSAAAIAFLEFPITYSQLARPYASGLLFSLLCYAGRHLFSTDNITAGVYSGLLFFLLPVLYIPTISALCLW